MIDKTTIGRIQKIVGKENVVEDKETRICYSYDATNRRFLPDLIVYPANRYGLGFLQKAGRRIKVTF